MKQLFGTDGIRGLAGTFPLDEKTVRIIGASLARRFRETLGRDPIFLTGRDTRESGQWIEKAFRAGAEAENAAHKSCGIITTPGVAYLTKAYDFDAGVVISASHNPYYDNGIKIFLPSGLKLDGETERLIERDISDEILVETSDSLKSDEESESFFRTAYTKYLAEAAVRIKPNSFRVVIDCANGAASGFVHNVFNNLGGGVVLINNHSNGRNINENCGSTHLDQLQSTVLNEKADLGFAFDGDADRALFIDETGKLVDGDATLWILAQYFKDKGKLANSTVVSTVMSNIGLEIALKEQGINLLRANVGDKFVLEKLIETGSDVGGEQSGHIIFPEISLVGDGMMTALLMLHSLTERDVSLSEATAGFKAYPQVLVNVKVSEKRPFEEVPAIADMAMQIENELGDIGRLLLRYSGTENLARVMIEGKDQDLIESQAHRLAAVIQDTLG